jgi:hypothetical protein
MKLKKLSRIQIDLVILFTFLMNFISFMNKRLQCFKSKNPVSHK